MSRNKSKVVGPLPEGIEILVRSWDDLLNFLDPSEFQYQVKDEGSPEHPAALWWSSVFFLSSLFLYDVSIIAFLPLYLAHKQKPQGRS